MLFASVSDFWIQMKKEVVSCIILFTAFVLLLLFEREIESNLVVKKGSLPLYETVIGVKTNEKHDVAVFIQCF